MAELKTQILIRNDTAENWESKNPILGVGEFGVEIGATDNKLKIGDGTTAWNALPYTYNVSELQKIAVFENDLKLTMPFGRYSPDASGSVTVPAEGMTAEAVLLNAFAVPEDPDVVDPKLTLTTNGDQSGEVGTLYKLPTATASVSTGSYEFGSQDNQGVKFTDTGTGIVFSSIEVSCSDPAKTASNTNSNDSVTVSLTTTELSDTVRIFEDEEKTFNFSASATHPASVRTPVNNLGTPVSAETIGEATLTKTASLKIKGYRSWFFYVGDDCTTPNSAAFIRANATNKGKSTGAATMSNIEIPGGTKRIVVAIPAASGNKSLTDVIDVDGMGLSAMKNFTKTTMDVPGANGYESASYNVWVAENTNGIAATHYNFIIG